MLPYTLTRATHRPSPMLSTPCYPTRPWPAPSLKRACGGRAASVGTRAPLPRWPFCRRRRALRNRGAFRNRGGALFTAETAGYSSLLEARGVAQVLRRVSEVAQPIGEPRVLVIIPAYNEEKTIASVLHDLRTEAPAYDRIVINDGSRDATGRIVNEMGERHLRLPCNLGYGHALQAGLKYGLLRGYEVMVSFDADGQHRAEDVKPLVHALLDSEAGMVIGSRFIDGRPYAGPT